MLANDYELATEETAHYPGATEGSIEAVNYCILGLIGEAGEIANKWKKLYRDDLDYRQVRLDLGAELGDVCWYVARLADELGFTLEEVMQANLEKLASRKERGKLSGSGDDR